MKTAITLIRIIRMTNKLNWLGNNVKLADFILPRFFLEMLINNVIVLTKGITKYSDNLGRRRNISATFSKI